MDINVFVEQLEAMYGRVSEVYQDAQGSVDEKLNLLPVAYKELGTVTEELQVAVEDLHQQNYELQSTRAILEAERQRYRDLFELAPDAYLITDSVGVIREANPATGVLLNISPKYLVGKPLSVFVPQEDLHKFPTQINALHKHDRTQEWTTRLTPRQGETFIAAVKVATVRDFKDNVVSLHLSIRDITDRQHFAQSVESNNYDISRDRSRLYYSRNDTITLNCQHIYLVCQGWVKLTTICENNEEVLVGLAGPHMVFGSSLTSLITYQATAMSKNVQLVSLPLSEISASPNLAQSVLPKITRRLQQSESLLAISGQRRVMLRLLQLLLLLKQEIGQPLVQGTRLTLRLTHNDLANACCTTRVTMTRLLGQLQQKGIISFDAKNHIVLKHDFEMGFKNTSAEWRKPRISI